MFPARSTQPRARNSSSARNSTSTRNSFGAAFAIAFALAQLLAPRNPARAAEPVPEPSPAVSEAGRVEVVGAIGGRLTDVQIDGNLAYVARGSNLEIEDVSDPKSPKLLSRTHLPGLIDSFGQFRGAVYAAVHHDDVFVIDATNPSAPKLLTPIQDEPERSWGDGNGQAIDAQIVGGRLLTGSGYKRVTTWGMEVLSDPLHPRYAGSDVHWIVSDSGLFYFLYQPPNDAPGGVRPARADDEKPPHTLEVVDAQFNRIGSISIPEARRLGRADRLSFTELDDSKLVIQGEYNPGLIAIDVADPSSPRYVFNPETDSSNSGSDEPSAASPNEQIDRPRSYDGPGDAQAIFVANTFAFVADGDHGLVILEVADPSHPGVRGTLALPGYSDFVAVEGNLAVVAQTVWEEKFVGAHFVDVSNPDKPVLMTTLEGVNGPWALSNGFGYVADPKAGLRIYDLSNPAAPKQAGAYAEGENCSDVAVSGGVAVIAAGGRLRFLDLKDPIHPALISSLPREPENSGPEHDDPPNADVEAVWVFGTRVLTRQPGPFGNTEDAPLFDISNPARPRRIRKLKLDEAPSRHATLGPDWACITLYDHTSGGDAYGLQLEKISGDYPRQVLFGGIGSDARVALAGDLAYVADGKCGVIILRPPKD